MYTWKSIVFKFSKGNMTILCFKRLRFILIYLKNTTYHYWLATAYNATQYIFF